MQAIHNNSFIPTKIIFIKRTETALRMSFFCTFAAALKKTYSYD